MKNQVCQPQLQLVTSLQFEIIQFWQRCTECRRCYGWETFVSLHKSIETRRLLINGIEQITNCVDL